MLALAKRRGARATEAMEEIDDRPRTNMIDLKPELQDAPAIKRADDPH